MSSTLRDPLALLVGEGPAQDQFLGTAPLPESPVVFSHPASPLGGMISTHQLDDVLASIPLGAPFVTVVSNGRDRRPEEVGYGPSVVEGRISNWADPAVLADRLKLGESLVFSVVERVLPELRSFCRGLSQQIGRSVTADAFLTPPHNFALAQHYDRVSSFIAQVEGEKVWDLFAPPIELPLVGYHPWESIEMDEATTSRLEEGPPDMVVVLAPGDVMWLPRGWVHRVHCRSSYSLHVALSFLPVTLHDVANAMLQIITESKELRADLPLRDWRGEFETTLSAVKNTVLQEFASVDVGELVDLVRRDALNRFDCAVRSPISAALKLVST
jgi:lysine-specific demethylase/histidyl-hydroxylase NO66